ncbi:MAG: SDR family oxidoreductase [Armatimonadetes bacterium]|nr:SDR family oxidoreductase [Armatimonadota bacterium]
MSLPVAVISSWRGLAGPAISLALAQCDYSLLINGPEDEIFSLQSGDFLGKILALPFDLTQEESVQQALLTGLEIFGRIDVLVNNIYAWNDASLHDITEEMWAEVLSHNLKGTFYCCRAAAAVMQSQQSGKIINVTSTSAFTGAHTQFAASCAAVHSLTRSLARELAPHVKVNTVACGMLDEPWIDEGGPELRDMLTTSVPLGRLCSTDDLAEAVAFFATGADFVTGQMLIVDGGETMR